MLITVPVLTAVVAANPMFYQYLGQWFGNEMITCFGQLDNGTDSVERGLATVRCQEPIQLIRTMICAVAGVLVLVMGWGLTRFLPWRLYRAAGRTRRASEEWQNLAVSAVQSLGGRTRPEVVFASAAREAFTIRLHGRALIVLPNGFLRLPRSEAEAVIVHECAHVVSGDVTQVWWARGVWWVTPFALVAPQLSLVGIALLDENADVSALWQPYWLELGVRSVLVVLLLWVVARGVLRSREHQADLATSAQGHADGLRALLRRVSDVPTSRLRALAALHPSPSRRLAVLDRGAVETSDRGVDGLAFGALGAVVVVLASFVIQPLVKPLHVPVLTIGAAALIPGVLIGLAWGAATWISTASTVPQPLSRQLVDALCLPVGVGIGMSLALTGQGAPIGFTSAPWLCAVGVVAVTGAAVWCRGIAAVRNRLGSSVTTRRGNATISVLLVVVFTGAISEIENASIFLGFSEFLTYLLWSTRWPLLVSLLAVALASWWWSRGYRLRLFTLSLFLSLPIAGARLLVADQITMANAEDQISTDVLIAAAAGLIAFMAASILDRRLSVGFGLASGPATTVITASLLALRAADPLTVSSTYLEQSLGILATAILVISVPLIVFPGRPRPVTRSADAPMDAPAAG